MSNYEPYDNGLRIGKPMHLAEPKDARLAYDHFISAIPERIEILKHFVQVSGYPLAEGRDFLLILNDFYFGVCSEIMGEEVPGALEISLAIDINMLIGEELVQRFDNLHWGFVDKGKKFVDYQLPVITGFTNVRDKAYRREFFGPLCGYATRIIKGKPKEDGLFLKWYDSSVKYA